jgi:hypothetical protein
MQHCAFVVTAERFRGLRDFDEGTLVTSACHILIDRPVFKAAIEITITAPDAIHAAVTRARFPCLVF